MKRFLTGFIGAAVITLAAVASVSAQNSYAVSYDQAGTPQFQGGYGGSAYYSADSAAVYSGGISGSAVRPVVSFPSRSANFRTYPGGIAPYARYGRIFGFTRPGLFGGGNPYECVDPEANNPYAGYTVTRGPRDFLMKNPPNIGP